MFVDESRVDEYKAAGYKLAADAIIQKTETERKKISATRNTRKKKEV